MANPPSDAIVFWPGKRKVGPTAASGVAMVISGALAFFAVGNDDFGNGRLSGAPKEGVVAVFGVLTIVFAALCFRAVQRLVRRLPTMVIDDRGIQVAGPIGTRWVSECDGGFEIEQTVHGTSDEGVTIRNATGQQAVVLAPWLDDWQGAKAALQQLAAEPSLLPRQRSALDVW